MLELALNYEEELKKKFRDTWFTEKYKFYSCVNYYEDFKVVDSTWNYHQFVSVDSNKNIIGYIGYCIDRADNSTDGLTIINFTDTDNSIEDLTDIEKKNKAIFGIDIANAIRDIFKRYHFRKLNFAVVIGNSAEKSYDAMIKKYNGRIVGIKKEDAHLYDGKYYDLKLYEILAKDYLKATE